MSKEVVTIECEGAGLIALDEFDEFQDSLKNMTEASYAQLRKNLVGLGFSSPFHLWKAPDGRWKTIDGHQRRRALARMAEEGVKIPERFPYVVVDAKSERIAKKKILALASMYGDVNRQGLFDFMAANDIPVGYLEENFKLPDIQIDSFRAEFFGEIPDGDGGKEHDGADPGPAKEGKKVTCPHCGEEFEP